MKNCLFIIIVFTGLFTNAQQANKLIGTVANEHGKPLEGITVSLFVNSDTVAIKITQTDNAGIYQFQNISRGSYSIKATSVGMKSIVSPSFNVKDEGEIKVADLIMKMEEKLLKNVTVTANTAPIQAKDGKLIFNVEKSLTAQGTTAFDQVRKTPGITVDAEDNLTLKGSSAVTIFIDGEQTYLSGQQLSTYLKSLPAESLQRIEVMSTPSSQYDAAGNAGIINIVTKKSSLQGYALNLRAGFGIGKYPQSTDGFVGNIRTKAFNLFGSYNYNYNHSNLVRSSFRTLNTNGKIISYDRRSVDPAIANNNSFKAGTDFYLNKKTTLGFVYNGTHNRWTRNAGGPTYLINASGLVDSIAQNKNFTDEPATSNAYNVNFATQLDTAGAQLSADADYAIYHDNSIGYLDNGLYSISGIALQPYQSLRFQQPSNITIRSVKTDLVLPHKGGTWKAGAKYAYVRTDNNFRYDSLLNGNYVYSGLLSNHFVYDEKVAAAYISFNTQLNKTVSIDAGLRVEHTTSKGSLLNTGIINNRDYTNWFPYVSVTKNLFNENSITASFTRRINRPLYANLNPTRYFFDKYSYHEGNPFLQPELSWNVGLSYTLKHNYVAAFTYTRTGNAIMGFATQDTATGILRVADRNFSHKTAADLLLVATFKPIAAWSVQTTVDIIYVSYLYNSGKDFFQPHKLNVDVQIVQTFSLPKSFTAELTTFYTSPSLNGIYVLRPYFQTDIGVRKSFFKAKLDAVLSCKDIFKTDRYWAYSVYSATSIRYDHRPDTRRINLALTYHIGGKLSAGKDRKLEEQNRL